MFHIEMEYGDNSLMFFIFIYVAVWISLALASMSRLVYLFSSLSYSVVQKNRKIGLLKLTSQILSVNLVV